MISVALDAMGGDNAPTEICKGAVASVSLRDDLRIVLCGQQEVIKRELDKLSYKGDAISICDASEVIATDEPPVMAIRRKKDSSIVKGLQLVKNGECDAFISAGSSGAILVGGQLIVGRIKGVERPPLAPLVPTIDGFSLLIDCGANVDARSSHLVQFAKMGSVYMENVHNIKNPKVAILNIGAEEEKGNALVKETFPLLKACPDINFIGSIEARDITKGIADVIVCEAFAGNVALKSLEGVASTLIGMIKDAFMTTARSKVGAFLVKPVLKKTLKKMDASEYGGAPLLGLNGLVVKAHGNATQKEIKNAIMQCITFKEQNISQKIADRIIIVDE